MKGPVKGLLAEPCFQSVASLFVRLVHDTERPGHNLDAALRHQRQGGVRGSGDRETRGIITVDHLVMT